MHVHPARRDNLAGGVDHARPAGRVGTERVGAAVNRGNLAVADENVADKGVAAGAVDHEAAAQQEVLRLDVPHL